MHSLKCFIFLFFLATLAHGNCQVSFTPQIPPTGIMLKSQLWNCFLVSSHSSPVSVSISLTLLNVADNTPVLSATSKYFTLVKGTKQVSISDVGLVQYNYRSSTINVDRNPNGFLPVGNFLACYTVSIGNYELTNKLDGGCIPVEVAPMSPPLLNTPFDKDTLATPYPNFSWMPPAPLNLFNNLSYDLVLAEVLPSQSAGDAVQRNIPVYSASNSRNLSLSYPASNIKLDTAKQYAWRVIAKNNGQFVGQSDVFTFNIGARNNPAVEKETNHPYMKLTRDIQSGLMHCGKDLFIQYRNDIGDSTVNFKIINLSSKDNGTAISGKLKVRYGINYLQFPLQKNSKSNRQDMYMLQVSNSRKEDWVIKFISDNQ